MTANQSSSPNGPQLRVWWRHWSVVLILAVLAGAVIWAMVNLGPWLRAWQDQRAATAAREKLEEAYRNDKYGGKTPEETFDLFISALEKGDIDLASKYFVINKQEQWKKTLEEYKTKALLIDFVVELEQTEKSWQKNQTQDVNIVEFYSTVGVEEGAKVEFKGQQLSIPAGTHTNTTRFEKYPSGIWKISVL